MGTINNKSKNIFQVKNPLEPCFMNEDAELRYSQHTSSDTHQVMTVKPEPRKLLEPMTSGSYGRVYMGVYGTYGAAT